jgi:hypothetical protein
MTMARFIIGQPEAVEELMAKLRYQAEAHPDWRRLLKATGRAHRQFREVPTSDAHGFYHGLLTGYAVAMKALQGKLLPRR